MKHSPRLWFKLAAAAGVAIAVFLFIDTILAYRFVSRRLARDEGMLLAVEEVSSLEHGLRRERTGGTRAALENTLRRIIEDRSSEIAWISVLGPDLQVIASSGHIESRLLPPPDRIRAILQRSQRYSTLRNTARGEILVALLPLKQALPAQTAPGSPAASPAASADASMAESPAASMVEIGIYLRETEGIILPLGRNLLISIIAAIALLASMILLLARLPSYVRGRALEYQLQLARSVQQRLLPESADAIEFAAECVPADEVGGDFYDVFSTETGETVLVLADVSGKGLPAALRMGVVHGAIRAICSGSRDSGNLACMVQRLNELLREKTSREFVTVFWAFYNPATNDLRYVNAGHLPPLLASRSGEIRRLDSGGPVLGLLPKALYKDECIRLDGAHMLIAYSDGLMEATRPDGEELGETRLLPVVRSSAGKPAKDTLRQIMAAAEKFIEGGEFHDDVTVLVAKLG